MHSKTFLSKDVGLVTKRATLDLDKLVLWGHGLGGMTAISTGIADKRAKVIIGLDPWMFPYSYEIEQKKYGVQKKEQCSLQVIMTEKFPSECDSEIITPNN